MQGCPVLWGPVWVRRGGGSKIAENRYPPGRAAAVLTFHLFLLWRLRFRLRITRAQMIRIVFPRILLQARLHSTNENHFLGLHLSCFLGHDDEDLSPWRLFLGTGRAEGKDAIPEFTQPQRPFEIATPTTK